jgi:phosphatidylglycerophosphatase A
VVGYLVGVIAIPFGIKTMILSFLLFRFFDILKPYPIRAIDRRWGGGWGVVMDDVAAGSSPISACA